MMLSKGYVDSGSSAWTKPVTDKLGIRYFLDVVIIDGGLADIRTEWLMIKRHPIDQLEAAEDLIAMLWGLRGKPYRTKWVNADPSTE